MLNVFIQTNAFFALPENVLFGMVTDPRIAIRRDALDKIREAKVVQESVLDTHVSNKLYRPKSQF